MNSLCTRSVKGLTVAIALAMGLLSCLTILDVPGETRVTYDLLAVGADGIKIIGNDGARDIAEAMNWSGNGTHDNPYIIEGETFNGSYTLEIASTTAYFIVRSNAFVNGSDVGSFRFARNIVFKDNYIHNSSANAIEFSNCYDIQVRDNRFVNEPQDPNRGVGFNLWRCENFTIDNNTLANADYPCSFRDTKKTVLSNCTIYNNSENGIEFLECSDILVRDNRVENHTGDYPDGFGILVEDSDAFGVINNTFYMNMIGIRFLRSTNVEFTNNTGRYDQHMSGVTVSSSVSQWVNIIGNTVTSVRDSGGIHVVSSLNVTLRNNTLYHSTFALHGPNDENYLGYDWDESNTVDGIPIKFLVMPKDLVITTPHPQYIIYKPTNVTIDNVVMPKRFYGSIIRLSRWFNVTDCTIVSEVRNEWSISVDDARVENCTLRNTSFDMDGNRCQMVGNDIEGGSIRLTYDDHLLEGNRFTNHKDGVVIGYANGGFGLSRARVLNNTFDNVTTAIFLGMRIYEVFIDNNTITDGSIQFDVYWKYDFERRFIKDHTITESNTVDGRPILFLKGAEDRTIDDEWGQVILYDCSGIDLVNLSLEGTGTNVFIVYCDNVSVTGSSIKSPVFRGITAWHSDNITISNCTMMGTTNAVQAEYCISITVVGNKMFNTTSSALRVNRCDPVLVHDNLIINSTGQGILHYWGSNVTIIYNQVEGCQGFGLELRYNEGGLVHHNNFIENNKGDDGRTLWPQCLNYNRDSQWDDGSEGNYWSDYRDRYPAAHQVGRTWNTSYNVSQIPSPSHLRSEDRYPLVDPFDRTPATLPVFGNITTSSSQPVLFNATGAADPAGIANITWTFHYNGTDVTLYGMTGTFKFDYPGSYEVTVTVKDTYDNWNSTSFWVHVTDDEAPMADAGEDMVVDQGTNVTLDGSRSFDFSGIALHTWTFTYDGRDVILEGNVTRWTFDVPDTYVVTLNVTDAVGLWAIDEVTVRVRDTEPPVAVTGGDIKVDEGTTVRFDGRNSTDNVAVVGYNWTFDWVGGVITLTGPSPVFTFDIVGTHQVRLEVVDAAGNTGSTVLHVTVRDVNAPKAVAGEAATIDQGDTVLLDGTGSTDTGGIETWRWTFLYDGGTVSLEGETVEFTFEIPGVYTISLLVTDGDGLTDVDAVQITVLDTEPPVADAGPDIEVEEGEDVELDGSASTDNMGIVSWSWTIFHGVDAIIESLGGMSNSTRLPVGGYTATLNVRDAAGNEDNDQLSIIVRAADAPVANAGPDATVEAGERHTFDASGTTSVNGIDYYSWNFSYDGEQVILTGQSPSFTFLIPGTYRVDLKVVDLKGNPDEDAVTITVVDTTAPSAHIEVRTREDSERRTFDGGTSTDLVGIVNWTWEIVFENEITHLYGEAAELHRVDPGKYSVTLTVRDAAGNEASDSIEFTIKDEDGGGLSIMWVAIIAIIVVVTVVVVMFTILGTKKPGEDG